MPIYEYQCSKCGHEFEALIRNRSDIPSQCPGCGAPKPAKAFSSFAVSAPATASQCETCPTAAAGCPGAGCADGQCPMA